MWDGMGLQGLVSKHRDRPYRAGNVAELREGQETQASGDDAVKESFADPRRPLDRLRPHAVTPELLGLEKMIANVFIEPALRGTRKPRPASGRAQGFTPLVARVRDIKKLARRRYTGHTPRFTPNSPMPVQAAACHYA
jgi:hypothetical protein